MTQIPIIGHTCEDFPSTIEALDEPNGLLAAGGDLSPERLIRAYSLGIFPWFEDNQPILWWSPAPRAVLYPKEFQPSKSLRKVLRKGIFNITMDIAFEEVIISCSKPRANGDGTWITSEMINAYVNLHQLGFAHSIEAWCNGELVGGLYGICLGSVFFGESMFSRHSNASKAAFCHLVDFCNLNKIHMIDCQVENPHLTSLGSVEISRQSFESQLLQLIPDQESLSRHQYNWSNKIKR